MSIRWIIALTIALAATGCSRAPTLIPVHGVVQFKGKPLTYGSVMFQPTGGGKIARSGIAKDGSFQLSTVAPGDGVPAGEYRVRVTAFELQQRQSTGQSAKEPTLGRSAIPKKYQSFGMTPLTFEIRAEMELPLIINLD